MSIALNMVLYNEEHRIYETLVKASKWVQEYVIVDQDSTDETCREVWRFAEDYGVTKQTKVIGDNHWGYCEPSRALAWENTQADWILVLDADEFIDDEFGKQLVKIQEMGYLGCKMLRSLWLGGEHRFTGDYQYRYFHKGAVEFLREIHTEPQPTVPVDRIVNTSKVAIWHHKSWQEQIRDEENYERILLANSNESNREAKLALNVHLKLLREHGLTAQEADAMSIEERNALGIGAS